MLASVDGLCVAPILGVYLKLLAPGSLKTYVSSWGNWRRWTNTLWPVEPLAMGLCLLSYLQEQALESKVLGIYSAACYFDKVFGGGQLGSSHLLQTVTKYCKKFADKKNQANEPLDFQKLVEICSGVDFYSCDIVRLRDIAFITTACLAWGGMMTFQVLCGKMFHCKVHTFN